MKKFLSKSRVALAYLMLGTFGLATATLASSTAVPAGGSKVEGTFKVGNVTQNINYTGAVNARVDDVVRYEVWYHNTEIQNSGKTADNFNIKVSLPTATAKSHVATATVGGTNTNKVTNSATVTTSVDTNLEYIPGTAFRRHNVGTDANPVWKTEQIPDAVVTGSGYTISKLQPCYNFQETITVQARVKAKAVSITKKVKVEGDSAWSTEIKAKPGQTLAYLITVKNEGNVNLKNVMVRDNLPPRMTLVPGSVKLVNSNYPNGYKLSDLIVQGGVNIGEYAPGANAQVRFNVKVPEKVDKCINNYEFLNVGVARPEGMGEYYNTAKVKVDYPCAVKPTDKPEKPGIEKPTTLPVTGPAEAVAGTIGGLSLAGASVYYRKGRKLLELKSKYNIFKK